MRSQQEQCIELLDKLRNGEGSLFKVTMSVNQLGRIDLYQWIYFIAQHVKRHIGQMQDNLDEWQNAAESDEHSHGYATKLPTPE
jgi:hypothetical protein